MSWICILLAVLTLAGGCLLLLQPVRLLVHGVSAPGTIVAMGKRSGHPVVSFTTADWQYVRFTSPSDGSSEHRVGAPVVVLYDPGDPKAARIKSFHTLWLGPVLLLGFSAILVAFGLVARQRAEAAGG